MTKTHETTITRLPFAGFYYTRWSDIIDHAVDMHIENAEEKWLGRETYYKSDMLDADTATEAEVAHRGDLGEILMRCMSYSDAYRTIAKDYVEGLSEALCDELGFDPHLTFESMDSPREYNFATDRVYAHIPLATAYLLLRMSRRDGHTRLEKRVKERFTSRDGFISGYSNHLTDWLEKPLREWDHNEICTLIEAVTPADDDEVQWDIYYPIAEHDYEYFDGNVDWGRYRALVAEKVAEYRDEEDHEAYEQWVQDAHRDTPTHLVPTFDTWRDTVKPMIVQPSPDQLDMPL